MIQNLYLVKDDVAGSYMVFDVCVNDGVAVRSFQKYCEKIGSMYKDVSLFKNGSFDTDTGKFSPIEPEFIVRGMENEV